MGTDAGSAANSTTDVEKGKWRDADDDTAVTQGSDSDNEPMTVDRQNQCYQCCNVANVLSILNIGATLAMAVVVAASVGGNTDIKEALAVNGTSTTVDMPDELGFNGTMINSTSSVTLSMDDDMLEVEEGADDDTAVTAQAPTPDPSMNPTWAPSVGPTSQSPTTFAFRVANVGNNGFPANTFPLKTCQSDCDSVSIELLYPWHGLIVSSLTKTACFDVNRMQTVGMDSSVCSEQGQNHCPLTAWENLPMGRTTV